MGYRDLYVQRGPCVHVIDILKKFLRSGHGFDADIAPDFPFAVIGDVHGCDNLLDALLQQLECEARDLPLVFVGDLIDRGPQSARVASRVMVMKNTITLKGNHEAMMLDFIDFPEQSAAIWLRNGGAQTLESYGVTAPDPADETALLTARDAFVDALGDAGVSWFRNLPLVWQSGNVVVSHAGGDPSQPIETRRGHGYLWGHRDFLRKKRKDGLWMAHGHYITERPSAENGRIAVDTGAYSTGCLTASVIEPGAVRFLQAR